MSQQALPCTAPPPTTKNEPGCFFCVFLHGCLVSPIIFPKEKVDFVSDIKTCFFFGISTKTQFSPSFHYMILYLTYTYYHSKGLIEAHLVQYDIK